MIHGDDGHENGPDDSGAFDPKADAASINPAARAAADKLGLEEIVHITNKVGLEYVAAKKEAERMDLMKATVRAGVMMRLDDGHMAETKLRRLTEVDSEYVTHLEKLIDARAECERLRIRYESYKNLFEARRSLLSYQKAEMKLL